MKKLITLTCAFVLALSLNSCGGSDDSPSGSSSGGDKIVGTWKLVGYTQSNQYVSLDIPSCDDVFIKFTSNNTGVETDYDCEDPEDISAFTWEKITDSPLTYSVTDNGTGETDERIVVFSADFKKHTVYQTQEDLNSGNGIVVEKQ